MGRQRCTVRVVVMGRRTELMAGGARKEGGYLYHSPFSLFFFRLSLFARANFFRLGGSSFSFFPFFFYFFDGVVIYVPVWLHLDLPPLDKRRRYHQRRSYITYV